MTSAWPAFTAAQISLDAALASLDADAILHAAVDLHGAAAQLAHSGTGEDPARIEDALAGALRRIESCRLRVMFLTDHARRRASDLTPTLSRTPSADCRWRPDRTA